MKLILSIHKLLIGLSLMVLFLLFIVSLTLIIILIVPLILLLLLVEYMNKLQNCLYEKRLSTYRKY
jgi:hypothetical protein